MANVTKRMEEVNASIARYLRALDQAAREESGIAEANRAMRVTDDGEGAFA